MSKKDFANKSFITNSSEETRKLGKEFARSLLARLQGETLIIALYGNLGSGKTTFVQGLAQGLGIKRRTISPTFIIVRSYKIRINDKGLMINDFYHIDLYRTNNDRDIEGLGIEEIVNNPENIVVIEWAEKLGNLMPKKRIDIKFFFKKENTRKITFNLGL